MLHKAKKSLGQNFLKSIPALNRMCQAGNVGKDDTILEIGPGKGALTEKLLQKAGKVIAVEKDRELLLFLKEKFKKDIGDDKLLLLEGDILEFDPKKYGLKEGKYKLIANIPYNITGAIIRKFLSESVAPSDAVILVQKEVAMRIVASDKKESILSLSVKAYGTPRYEMKVEKRFFNPAPKVDSGILSIRGISRAHFMDTREEKTFFKAIKAGFAHKRKILKKNLETITTRETIDRIFTKFEIAEKARAEDLSIVQWLEIARMIV